MTNHDVIILGGGPAGISALLWCHSLGLRAVLLERTPELGGQMLMMYHPLLDYPGLPGLTGAQLRDQFAAHLDQLQLNYRVGVVLGEIDLRERRVQANGAWWEAGAMILATGARKRRLGIPGEDEFELRGVSFSATRDHSLYAGKKVCVVGGGDSAVENALILSRVCPQVTLVHRSAGFRARPEWLDAARAASNIEFVFNTEVTAIEGREQAERVILQDRQTGAHRTLVAEGIFIRVGIAPNTEAFTGQIELNDAGYIKVDHEQRTSAPMIFAAGDVCQPVCLSVATAVGHGALAAKAITQRLRAEK